MNEDFSADLLTLVDEDGQEHEFEILDIIENDDGCFYALLPTFDDPQEQVESEGTYYIFQAFEEDGEQQLAEVRTRICWIVWPPSSRPISTRCSRKRVPKNNAGFPAWFADLRMITLHF